MADPASDDLELQLRAAKVVSSSVVYGGGACTEERRLLLRHGEPPSPSHRRSCGEFRRRSVVLDEEDARARKDLVVFSYVFWAFL